MGTPAAKQGLLSLQIKDKKELYSAYMPYVKGGAIFVPTPKRYQLGDEVFLMVNFLEDKSRLPVVGKVVWVSPMGQMGGRRPGVGVQMSEAAENHEIRNKIEIILAGMLDSDNPTHTM
jgi:type IV pilus assembly protein PilZ